MPSHRLFGMRTVQADSCLNSEQIDTLFINVGGQEGGFGGWVVILGQRPKIWTCLSTIFILTLLGGDILYVRYVQKVYRVYQVITLFCEVLATGHTNLGW